MAQLSIHVEQVAPDHYVVREKGERELGHYPSQQEAENVGRLMARKRKAILLVNGRTSAPPQRSTRGWLARFFGR